MGTVHSGHGEARCVAVFRAGSRHVYDVRRLIATVDDEGRLQRGIRRILPLQIRHSIAGSGNGDIRGRAAHVLDVAGRHELGLTLFGHMAHQVVDRLGRHQAAEHIRLVVGGGGRADRSQVDRRCRGYFQLRGRLAGEVVEIHAVSAVAGIRQPHPAGLVVVEVLLHRPVQALVVDLAESVVVRALIRDDTRGLRLDHCGLAAEGVIRIDGHQRIGGGCLRRVTGIGDDLPLLGEIAVCLVGGELIDRVARAGGELLLCLQRMPLDVHANARIAVQGCHGTGCSRSGTAAG